MSIEDLRKIRNRSVAQQNQLTYLEMKHCVKSLKEYPWIADVLERYGQSSSAGLLVRLRSIPDQEGMLWHGSWLAITKKFYEFEALTNRSATKIIEIESWRETSPEVSAHTSGIGKTPAYIALELLSEYERS